MAIFPLPLTFPFPPLPTDICMFLYAIRFIFGRCTVLIILVLLRLGLLCLSLSLSLSSLVIRMFPSSSPRLGSISFRYSLCFFLFLTFLFSVWRGFTVFVCAVIVRMIDYDFIPIPKFFLVLFRFIKRLVVPVLFPWASLSSTYPYLYCSLRTTFLSCQSFSSFKLHLFSLHWSPHRSFFTPLSWILEFLLVILNIQSWPSFISTSQFYPIFIHIFSTRHTYTLVLFLFPFSFSF